MIDPFTALAAISTAVKLVKTAAQTVKDVESLGPGSCFGVGALVDPDHRRFGTATALGDAELLEMNREEFLFAMQELPMFGLEMLHDLEQRLEQLKQKIVEG